MKKLLLVCSILLTYGLFAQELVPFNIRKQEKLRGGIKMIGNQILNSDPPNNSYNDTNSNDNLDMMYVDIDTDPNTFSSSAASLSFNNPTCTKVRYAALYWGGMYKTDDHTKKNIKLKIPSKANYIDIQADSYIYDDMLSQVANPYICYKDITDLLKTETNLSGEYMVANVKALEARDGTIRGGVSAGWSLVIIYEDPNETSKQITTFDGYARVFTTQTTPHSVTFSFSGFKTLPAPFPVNARFGVMALEGDANIAGDKLSVLRPDNTYFDLSNSINPSDNFFNSTISFENSILTDRRPASKNTLGWDIDLFTIPNTGNSIIQNDQTSATFKAYTTQDLYNIFFSTFEVEIIEPQMMLVKTAEDASGNILNNQTIPLGSTLYYGLDFQNIGNDDAIEYQIKDILPKGVVFDNSIPVELPAGVTYSHTLNHSNQTELTFNIPDALVVKNAPKQKIRFAVRLSPNCSNFQEPCSEIITNKALSIYKGHLNHTIINDRGSSPSIDACNIASFEDTIFYANISSCTTTQTTELLCGENLRLTATAGFDSYLWKNQNDEVISESQHAIVSLSGTYRVIKRKNDCVERTEIFHIVTTQRQSENPLIPFARKIFSCSVTQKLFPQIFLCGNGASQNVDLNAINNVSDVIWEKYTGTNLVRVTETCPPDDTINWTMVHRGKTISLTQEGIYRLSLTFNNGCVAQYFFRVHSSPINPTFTKKDVYCDTPGEISIQNASSDYQYAVILQGSTETPVYQSNSTFNITQKGIYTALVRKKNDLEEGCIFRLENIDIKGFEQKLNIVQISNETCKNQNDGSISFIVSDGNLPYKAELKNKQTGHTKSINITTDNQLLVFNTLSPSDYSLKINDLGSCENIYDFTIKRAADLSFTPSNEFLCLNNEPTSKITLSFSDTELDPSEVRYAFNGESSTYTFTQTTGNQATIYPNLPSGTHRITLFHNGCQLTQNIDFQQSTPITIVKINDTSLISAIRISASGGTGDFSYYFNDIRHLSDTYYLRSFDDGYIDNGLEIKKVRVKVEDGLGCYKEEVFDEPFYDIEIPNHFTPNGDGFNDVWGVKNALSYPKMKIHIYDRWGRKIITLRSKDTWDGMLNNQPLPSGDYWYQIIFNELKDRRVYFGNFTLYR